MLSRRPYLIRAMYDWLVDSGELPHVLVEADRADVEVPGNFVQDGRIVLNVGPDAVSNLSLGNDCITFNARFQGKPMSVSFPPESVIAIYGRDSGQGMMFGPEDDAGTADDEQGDVGSGRSGPERSGPELAAVESDPDSQPAEESTESSAASSKASSTASTEEKTRKRKKPNLKIIK